ncbi:hypothetical protein F441_09421 [Phytophthora nicotianae CJ01A1]|uniref:Uncharacterized protein n=3 Tax=Phytophthora nicotianae TaxID=4792 RepID=V9F5T3_PHYNI|nr:hypothetical protein F443_09473 [Phytophthora nicotianae P1569]ETP15929.1 hypothetical protein F441_09421 [Phytophthora nicotianae CJ01A1]
MHAHPASNVARPQRSMHAYPKLSSEIVRPVFQRDIATKNELARSLKRGTTRSDVTMQRPALSCTSQSSYLAAKLTQAEHHLNSSYNINSRFTDGPLDSANARARKHFRDFDIDQSQPKQKRIRLKTQRRHEQCRANQARYRLKQIDHAKWVKESVLKLRADIPVLELQRTALRHGGQQDVWNAVVKYLRIFRFGVLVTLPPADIEEANIADNSIENEETKQQCDPR